MVYCKNTFLTSLYWDKKSYFVWRNFNSAGEYKILNGGRTRKHNKMITFKEMNDKYYIKYSEFIYYRSLFF